MAEDHLVAEEAEEKEAEKNFSALTTVALLEGPEEDFLVEVEEVVDLGTEVVEENEVVALAEGKTLKVDGQEALRIMVLNIEEALAITASRTTVQEATRVAVMVVAGTQVCPRMHQAAMANSQAMDKAAMATVVEADTAKVAVMARVEEVVVDTARVHQAVVDLARAVAPAATCKEVEAVEDMVEEVVEAMIKAAEVAMAREVEAAAATIRAVVATTREVEEATVKALEVEVAMARVAAVATARVAEVATPKAAGVAMAVRVITAAAKATVVHKV